MGFLLSYQDMASLTLSFPLSLLSCCILQLDPRLGNQSVHERATESDPSGVDS